MSRVVVIACDGGCGETRPVKLEKGGKNPRTTIPDGWVRITPWFNGPGDYCTPARRVEACSPECAAKALLPAFEQAAKEWVDA